MRAATIILGTWRPLVRLSRSGHRSNVKRAAQTVANLFDFVVARLSASQYRFVVPICPENIRFENGDTEGMSSMLDDDSAIAAVNIRRLYAIFQCIGPVQFARAAKSDTISLHVPLYSASFGLGGLLLTRNLSPIQLGSQDSN